MLCTTLLLIAAMSTSMNNTLQDEIASLNMSDDMDTGISSNATNQATQTAPAPYVATAAVPYTTVSATPADTSVVAYYSHYVAPPPIANEVIQSKFVSPSVYTKKGFFIQFVNNNANCSPTVIGGTRTNETDVRMIPAYIEANESHITKLAVRTLVRHLQTTQCSTACLETLSDDDFGISFSVASLSGKGMSLNPSRRHEAPLFYCHVPGLVEPCYVQQNQQVVETAHMVNCYVHILPAHQRRNKMIAKAKEDRIEAANIAAAPAVVKPAAHNMNPPPGKMAKVARGRSSSRSKPYSKNQNQGNRNQPPRNLPPTPTVNGVIQQAQVKHTAAQFKSPPLPASKTPSWVTSANDLPENV